MPRGAFCGAEPGMTSLDASITTAERPGKPAGTSAPQSRQEIWLLGQPPLGRYLDFVSESVIGGADMPQRQLADDWRAANDHYAELEEREAGLADTIDWRNLDPELEPLADAVRADSRFHHTFPTLAVTFGMVELDKLVVYQLRVTGDFVDGLARQLGPAPDPATIFRTCQPLDAPPPRLQVEKADDNRYLFTSESHDMRFHEARLFGTADMLGYSSFGAVAGIVGVVVGFGGNFLNVIRSDDRFLLNNGYHRAVALRSLGVTHAPCVIQTVTRRDELNLVGPERVVDDPVFYYRAKRPPLLKDFLDPRIAKRLPTRPRRKLIEVSFKVHRTYVTG